MVVYQFCSNEGPRIQDGPVPGGPRFKPEKYIENIQKSSSSVPGAPRFKPEKYIENIQKSSSSELLGLEAENLVCSIA